MASLNPFEQWYDDNQDKIGYHLDSQTSLLKSDLELADDGNFFRIEVRKLNLDKQVKRLLRGINLVELAYHQYGEFSEGFIPSPNILIGIDTITGIYQGRIIPFGYEGKVVRIGDIVDFNLYGWKDIVLFQIKSFDLNHIEKVVVGPLEKETES